jgi:predicted nucleic acid-binding protein
MPYFIDTNIFIRVIVRDDEKKFKDCLQLLQLVKTHKIDAITSSLIKSEVEWVLRSFYKLSREEIIKQISYIENITTMVSLNVILDRNALGLYSKFPVKYVDAQIASIPEIRNKEWTIVSYDHDFDKLGVKRLEPADVVKNFSM